MSAKPASMKAPTAPDTVAIEVDGRKIQARKGAMLIEVTDAAGIYIPRFCYHDKLSIAANCRMCLVDVEKAPKPLPACAMPVTEGMKVFTRSERAHVAQKGTMEFLLINHPLDCPVCDQGGECELQDLAMGYGKDVSRFTEAKRIINDKNIGPLIATDMTRCIHCTRCVRFGQEIAGVMEFGGLGRGEHMEIRTFLDKSVDSEVSGNVIDLCPVGALTSKPFRYTARPWELDDHPSVSPHDCVGANIIVQARRGRVMRVLPRHNEAINECWLADRDRFSYEALNGEDRLRIPMIRRGTKWEETDWPTALEYTVAGIKKIFAMHGPDNLGALAAPGSTLEEFYLLQKLIRSLGSGNVDHRLRQMDFSDDSAAPVFPSLGRSIADLENIDGALFVGANPRKDQPLINLRLRKAVLKGARFYAVNPVDYDFSYKLSGGVITDPLGMTRALAGIAQALNTLKKSKFPSAFANYFGDVTPSAAEQEIAESLHRATNTSVLLGSYALRHLQASALRAQAQYIADLCGAKLGQLPEANSTGAWLAGCVPHRGVFGGKTKSGRNALDMLRRPLKSYLLLGVEPELDCLDATAVAAMRVAEFVVMMTTFRPTTDFTRAVEYAHVWLPLAPFTETDGTFVNVEGRRQEFAQAVSPLGEARPGWKILRMIGHLYGLSGFEQASVTDIRREMNLPDNMTAPAQFPHAIEPEDSELSPSPGQLMRLTDVPIYAVDAIVRRAPALQKTADNPKPAARMNAGQIDKLGLKAGSTIEVAAPYGVARLNLLPDNRVPEGCVLIPAGYKETSILGADGPVRVKATS